VNATKGPSRRAVVVLAALVLGLLGQGLAPAGADATTRRQDHMVVLTNDDRADRSRAALALDQKLSRYAERHSRRMAKAGHLFHSADLADVLRGRHWSIGGENVGVGSTLSGLEDAFMESRAHRRNILRKGFDHLAVGIVRSDGTYWVTVIFYG
jgi:uncharacterized protein YkwD